MQFEDHPRVLRCFPGSNHHHFGGSVQSRLLRHQLRQSDVGVLGIRRSGRVHRSYNMSLRGNSVQHVEEGIGQTLIHI